MLAIKFGENPTVAIALASFDIANRRFALRNAYFEYTFVESSGLFTHTT
jgi:hypothetical protein